MDPKGCSCNCVRRLRSPSASRLRHSFRSLGSTAIKRVRALVGLGFALLGALAFAGDVRYIYDDLGRLIAVVDVATETAVYTYDAVGNILSIARQPSSQVSVLEFTPKSGDVGTTVTIYGTGFSTTAASNIVKFNGTVASVSSATETQLVISVPTGATTGPISVTVATKTGSSTRAFVVGPPSDVTGTLIVNGPPFALLLGKPKQMARLTFSGTAGQFLHLQFMGVTIPGATSVTIKKPDSTTLATTTFTTAGVLYDVPQLTATGTYTVVISPPATSTGTAAILLTGDVVGTLVDGAAPLNISLTREGQRARLAFTGAVGQNFGIGVSNLTLSPSTVPYANVYVYKPDATVFLTKTCYTSSGPGCQLNLNNLPAAGTYSVLVQLQSTGTSSFNIQLNSDVTATLSANTALPVSLRSGQNARLSFTGAAGDSVALEFAQVSTVPAGRALGAYVYRPTDTVTANTAGAFTGYWQSVSIANSGATLSLPALPAAGTYKVVLDTTYQETANVSVTLTTGTALTIDAPSATAATIATAGETARFTFTGAVGQNLGLGVSNLTLSPSTVTYAYVYVYKPDASQLLSQVCYATTANGPGCQLNLNNLPVAGTYSIVVVPYNGATGSFNIQLNSDVTATLSANTALPVSLRSGQNARLSFTGAVGDVVGLEFTQATTVPAGRALGAYVYRPTDTVTANTAGTFTGHWQSVSIPNAGATLSLPALPAAGTYRVVIDTSYQETANVNVTLRPATPIAVDGASLSIATSTPGTSTRVVFSASAGQNLGLGLSGLTHTPTSGSATTMYVYRPDGVQLAVVSCYTSNPGGGCQINLSNLPQTGTYSALLVPPASSTLNATLTLSRDVTGTLANNTPLAVSLARQGQNGRLTFSGTAGQLVGLEMSQLATVPARQIVYMTLLKPDGTQLATTNSGSGDGAVLSATLPSTGTYTVFVDPSYGATANFTLVLNPPGDVLIDGASLNVGTSVAGEGRSVSFIGAAGQNLGLGLSGLTHTPASGSATTMYVFRPDGVQLAVVSCYTSNPGGGCQLNLANLAQAGTYNIYLLPPASSTLNATLTLSSDVTGALTSTVPFNVTLGRSGQNGRFTFSGNAAETSSIVVSSLATNPVSQTVTLIVYKPDGTQLASQTISGSGGTMSIASLPVTGSYKLLIDPSFGATATLMVTKSP